jgi:hypothetical protein
MRTIVAMLGMLIACGAAACGPPPAPKALPTDLPPPEYETPRGYDLGGAKGTPSATPAPAPAPAPATQPKS